jgi:hypothetical protein
MTRKKLFNLVADVSGSPIDEAELITHLAGVLNLTASVIKRQGKAARAAKLAAEAAEQPDVEEATRDLVFDGASYWRRERDGNYGKLGREDMLLELRKLGFTGRKVCGSDVSAAEEALHYIQTNNRAVYAAPFCGRPAGRHVENGLSILATDSPRIVAAERGIAGPLMDFFADLFGRAAGAGGDAEWQVQLLTFFAWLRRARAALRHADQHLPGQLLALVGPPDCGKSLAQSLITRMLGGRDADPSLWLTGKSDFNDGIWGAEHWAASDSNIEDTLAARKMLRDRIKEATANPSLSCHRKNRGEITLRPIARLTLSANDDADSSFVLPTLDPSTRDKVIYFKCHRPPVPFPTETEEGSREFFQGLTDSLPGFLHVVESFNVPEDRRKGRFGVVEFHHPDLVNLLVGANPDSDLADIISWWLDQRGEDFTGTAAELYGHLLNSSEGEAFRRGCQTLTKMGQVLGRLSRADGWTGRITDDPNHRVGPNRRKQRIWTIRREVAVGG